MLDRMRVLVSCSGAASHFNPLAPFVEALDRRGNEVLVVVPPALSAIAEATGQPYRTAADPPADELAAIWARFPAAPPAEAAVLTNREIFGRLNTAAMLPALEEACTTWQPDFILREPCEYAATVAALRSGIPHAQVAISLARLEASCLNAVAPVLEPYRSGITEEILAAPYLTRFPASLDPSPFSVTHRFRGPGTSRRPLPDWWGGNEAPLVYLTFGTVAGSLPIGLAVCRTGLDAVTDLPVRVLLTTGRTTDLALLGAIPANVHVEEYVPQDDVLAEASVVVCHGGSGTTFGALAAGVPLVILPMFADQPANGRLVSAAGAGLVVGPGRAPLDAIATALAEHVPEVRAAIETMLGEVSYRQAATRIAEEMNAMPAVDEVLAAFGL
jgi:UDP:flavonoid glycosyltransferase YjiC (YdhE family)